MSKVLIVIPHDRFRDEELSVLLNSLKESSHSYNIGSTHHTEARGQYGLIIKPDVEIKYVETSDYDCLVLIGGHGISEFGLDSGFIRLIADFYYDRKIIAAIGMAVSLLAYAGILTHKRVTCDPTTIPKVTDAGAFYTGANTEWDGDILTASGYQASEEFAKELLKGLKFDS